MRDLQENLNLEVYNAIADVLFKHHKKGEHITEKQVNQAIEWFQLHFFESDDYTEE